MSDPFGSKIINLCVAYMDVGEGREQERKLCETQATARLLVTFHALILINVNPNLIRPDLCRGSLTVHVRNLSELACQISRGWVEQTLAHIARGMTYVNAPSLQVASI